MKGNNGSTLEARIYSEIRKAIFGRKIKPKTLLNEDQLAKAFNVSRTPVRHSLKRLESERVVEIISKKGAYIYEPSLKEIEEAFHVKVILGVDAAKVACDRATESQIDQLEELTYIQEQFYKENDYENALINSNLFHFNIIKISDNELLLKYYIEATDLTNLYLAFYDDVPENPRGPQEQREILRAMRERNKTEVAQKFAYHLNRVKESMIYDKRDETEINISNIFKSIK